MDEQVQLLLAQIETFEADVETVEETNRRDMLFASHTDTTQLLLDVVFGELVGLQTTTIIIAII